MTFEAAASNADVAWITLAGTLGGVVVTAAFGVLTAFLAQQWQYRRSEQEHRFEAERELRTVRRDCYVRYVVSAQNVFDRSYDFYLKNRAAPAQVAEFALQPPQVLNDALARNETCRVEVLLLAGDEVRAALKEYDDRLRAFWRAVGTDPVHVARSRRQMSASWG